VTTLADLLDKLALAATTTTEKGSAFERLVASYLRTAPEFADRFSHVYLWQDWPERGKQADHGIDLVAWDLDTDGWCAIQCKFFAFDHHVAKADIDSFLAASSKRHFTSRLIFSTAKDWGPTIEKLLDGLHIPVVRIGYTDMLESKVDWSQFDVLAPPDVLPTAGRNRLRRHQREARDAVREGFVAHDRGQLIMACGTGKTFRSLKVAEQLVASRDDAKTSGRRIVEDDIFFYAYGLLHSPEYRETYAADLRKMLPRIPLVDDARPFVDAGRRLAELHLGYEQVVPCPLDGLDHDATDYEFYRVDKMRFAKPTAEQKAAGERNDRTTNLQRPDHAARHPAQRLPVPTRVALGHRMDHGPLPGEDRQGVGHRQRPQRLEPGAGPTALHPRSPRPHRDRQPRDDGDRRRAATSADPRGAEPERVAALTPRRTERRRTTCRP
jgi:predicted helicase